MSASKKQKIKHELVLLIESAKNLSESSLLASLRDHTVFPVSQSSYLAFSNETIAKTINKILSNLECKDSVSDETIYRCIIQPCISFYIKTDNKPDEKLAIDLIDSLHESFPLDTWEIFRPIYGADLAQKTELTLGRYFIRTREEYKKYVKSQEVSPGSVDLNSHREEPYLVASVKVQARESIQAINHSNILFKRLENILRYMISPFQKELDIGIFDYSGIELSQLLCISSQAFQTFSNVEGSLQLAFLDAEFPVNASIQNPVLKKELQGQSFFLNKSMGHKRIWEITQKDNMTEMEKRILAAVEWVGKGMRDIDPSRSFTQLIFALEALFVYQEKNVLVSPSIASQISEYSAFVLGDNMQERIDIEKKAKAFYSKRSAVVHGGNSEILEQDCHEAYSLLNGILVKLNTDETFIKIEKMNDLVDWIKNKKYSY